MPENAGPPNGEELMTDSAEVTDNSPSVSSRETAQRGLRTWAKRHKVDDVPYVKGLLAALPNDENMSMWAARDPFQYLPFASPTPGRALTRIARIVEVVRNCIVFVPVALTWLAISFATGAFAKFVEDEPNLSFLQYWESGGEGFSSDHTLGHVWRIGSIAFIDFVLIAGIVVMTLAASVVRTVGARRNEAAQAVADFEREEVAISLAIALAGKRSATPETIAESIAKVLNNLTDAVRQVNGATERLNQTAKGVLEASAGVSGLGAKMDSLSESSNQLGDRLEGVSAQISGEISRSVNELGRAVNEFKSAVTSDTERALQTVANFRTEVSNDATRALEAVARLSESLQVETSQALETITTFNNSVAEEATQGVRRVVAGLEEIGELLAVTGASVELGTSKLREDLDDISTLLARIIHRLDE
jgi:uncharacterized protein YoxC